MAEEPLRPEHQDDVFAYHDELLADGVRLLLGAGRAGDTKAVDFAAFYFFDYLAKVLHRHLGLRNPAWDGSSRPLDFSAHRWFDGLSAEPEFLGPGRLRVRGELCWAIGQEHWYRDPFDFEIELCPKTGAFQGYVMRFGDHRLLEVKVHGAMVSAVPVGGWMYEIERRVSGTTPNH